MFSVRAVKAKRAKPNAAGDATVARAYNEGFN
jgi:hypothetical protein